MPVFSSIQIFPGCNFRPAGCRGVLVVDRIVIFSPLPNPFPLKTSFILFGISGPGRRMDHPIKSRQPPGKTRSLQFLFATPLSIVLSRVPLSEPACPLYAAHRRKVRAVLGPPLFHLSTPRRGCELGAALEHAVLYRHTRSFIVLAPFSPPRPAENEAEGPEQMKPPPRGL